MNQSEPQFYPTLAKERGDSQELRDCVHLTVQNLLDAKTSSPRPGVLLGKIQSGKTRAFLGAIAEAFDRGYDVAIILTKGTKSLVRQTLHRVRSDFRGFIDGDRVQAFDVMALPSLTPYELKQKLILVAKKEDDNMKRLLKAFQKEALPAI